MLQHARLDIYTITITCYRQRERKIHEKLVKLIPLLQSEHVQRFLFPELNASAFDPASSVRLSWKGHRMRALDLAHPQGCNLDLKERLGRETQTPGP